MFIAMNLFHFFHSFKQSMVSMWFSNQLRVIRISECVLRIMITNSLSIRSNLVVFVCLFKLSDTSVCVAKLNIFFQILFTIYIYIQPIFFPSYPKFSFICPLFDKQSFTILTYISLNHSMILCIFVRLNSIRIMWLSV